MVVAASIRHEVVGVWRVSRQQKAVSLVGEYHGGCSPARGKRTSRGGRPRCSAVVGQIENFGTDVQRMSPVDEEDHAAGERELPHIGPGDSAVRRLNQLPSGGLERRRIAAGAGRGNLRMEARRDHCKCRVWGEELGSKLVAVIAIRRWLQQAGWQGVRQLFRLEPRTSTVLGDDV